MIYAPLDIGIFVSIWYTFWIVVAGMIYIGIFKWFTRIGGRNEAKKLLRSPKKNLEDFVNQYDMKYAWKVYKAVEGDNRAKTKCGLSVDSKWMDIFIQLCHWTGYQVVIRKDAESDIEEMGAESFDMNYLEKFSESFVAFNERTRECYSRIKMSDENLKKEFEL